MMLAARIVLAVAVALALIGAVCGCTSTPAPVTAAAAAQTALTLAIDREVDVVRGEVRGAYLAAARDCAKGDGVCAGHARDVALSATAARSALAKAAVAAGRASADLIEQANRCPDHDAACERYALSAAAARAAEATVALERLRATREERP